MKSASSIGNISISKSPALALYLFFALIYLLSCSTVSLQFRSSSKNLQQQNRAIVSSAVLNRHHLVNADRPHLHYLNSSDFSDGDVLNIDRFGKWLLSGNFSLESIVLDFEQKRKESRESSNNTVFQNFVNELKKIEKGCSVKRQLFAYLLQNWHYDVLELWYVDSVACYEISRRFEWESTRKKVRVETKIGDSVFRKQEFYVNKDESPEVKIAEIKKDMNTALSSITAIVKQIWDEVRRRLIRIM